MLTHDARQFTWDDTGSSQESDKPGIGCAFSASLKCISRLFYSLLQDFSGEEKGDATRGWSEKVINAIADHLPGLIGGSADLATSNKLYLQAWGDFEKNTPAERNIRYGGFCASLGVI
jgi:transketolase